MVIDKALESDSRSLQEIAISAFRYEEKFRPAHVKPGGPLGHDAIRRHEQWIKDHDYYKLIVDGKIIGGCIVKVNPSYHELFGILLHKDYISKGIGSKFLCEVMQLYPKSINWMLETPDYSKHSHRFYRRNGFIEAETTMPDPDLGYGFIIFHHTAKNLI